MKAPGTKAEHDALLGVYLRKCTVEQLESLRASWIRCMRASTYNENRAQLSGRLAMLERELEKRRT